jgi:hypothetical protein
MDEKIRLDEKKYSEILNSKFKDFIKPFNLAIAPLFRVQVLKLSEEKHLMFFDLHHIISDGISMGILVNEFTSLYKNQKLPDLKIQYKDYAQWHNNFLKSIVVKKQKNYWMKKLDGLTYTKLPMRNMKVNTQFDGENRYVKIEKNLMNKIYTFCREKNITVFVFMLSVLKVLLLKKLNQSDLSISIPIAGRKHKELENLIGPFLNVLVLRTIIKTDLSFYDHVSYVNMTVLEAQDNQDYPYEELYIEFKEKNGFAHKSLFSIMFNYMPYIEQKISNPEDISFRQFEGFEPAPKYDITFYDSERIDWMVLNEVYKKSVYESSSIEEVLENFIDIVKLVIDKPKILIRDISLYEDNTNYEANEDFNKYYDNEEFSDV